MMTMSSTGETIDRPIFRGHVRSFIRPCLRGMAMLRDDIRPNERRDIRSLVVNPNVIKYLQSLGITAVELLPIHAFVQDRHLIAQGLKNYWGYNSLNFFSIEPGYLSDGSRNEMRVAVRRLHAAGIEVILDVVYNHTAEGSELGPTLSFRGLDNASYYRLVQDNRRHYVNDTGTGNTMNLSHPRILQMVMDSLRHWVTSVSCRRLSLRSGRDAGTRSPWLRLRQWLFRCLQRGSRC